MKQILKDIILENQNTDLPEVIQRNVNIPVNLDIIVTIIGPRRSGKTYLLYDCIKKLEKNNVNKKRVLFLNFEDERLEFRTNNLDLILQAYQEIYPDVNMQDVYFFFDEIQNVNGWEKFIRRIYDTKSRHIFITGSNSKLLSSEIATELRGRTLTFANYPLSFNEYLSFNNIEKKLHPQKNKSLIIHYANKFLIEGGFPDTINFDAKNRINILQQYFNVMIFRDIIERYNVSGTETLKFFIKKIFAGVTSPFSVNKTYHDLKSLGYKVSNKYLYEYLAYSNTVFLTQAVNKFDFSEIKQEKSDKKIYIIDNGLLAAIEFSVSQNYGKLLENLVAIELLKADKEIFYFKGNYECDFIVKKENSFLPMQVSYNIDEKNTKERELRGLYEACEYLNIKNGIIASFDTEEKLSYRNIDVEVIPFYKYFLK